MDKPTSTSTQGRLRLERYIRTFAGIVISVFLLWRVYNVIILQQNFGADTWVRFGLSGLILGGMYALIAIGYTLVYGIMFMINFAHGEVMMLGAFGGYFTFEALRFIPAPTPANPELNFLNAHPVHFGPAGFFGGYIYLGNGRLFPGKDRIPSIAQSTPLDPVDHRDRRIHLFCKTWQCCFLVRSAKMWSTRIFWIAALGGS